jgi:uncharacterized protein (DUF2141 family)
MMSHAEGAFSTCPLPKRTWRATPSLVNRVRVFVVTVVLIMLSLPAKAGELRITVEGIRSSKGTVLIGLYDSAGTFDRAIELSDKAGFLNDPERVAGAALRANTTMKSSVVFSNLEPGRYGIIVFQDENGTGQLDKNVWGVPTEPYGFSNNAQGSLGPPAFDEAAILFDGSDKAVVVTLIYHGGASKTPSPPPGNK